MLEFTLNHINRYCFPTKIVLVIEDDLMQQRNMANKLYELFGHQSSIAVMFCPTAISAAAYLLGTNGFTTSNGNFLFPEPSLIILDHDLQWGNGVEFLNEFRSKYLNTIIITASGIPANNERMMKLGANHCFTKNEIYSGLADSHIMNAVEPFLRCPSA